MSAAADYAANKTIAISDLRGRVRAGKDNMGGSAASRLTVTTMTPNGTTLGATGGAQVHTHAYTVLTNTGGGQGPPHAVSDATPNFNTLSTDHTHQVNFTGSTVAESSVQPAVIVSAIIKL